MQFIRHISEFIFGMGRSLKFVALLRGMAVSLVLMPVWSTTLKAENLAPVDCVINPFRIADVSSVVPGVLTSVNVERSEWVEQGQVLAMMDSNVEEATVELAEVRAAIDSEIELGKVNLAFDKKRHKRIEKLHKRQVISVEHRDEAERELELSRWKLQQAEDLKNVRKLELIRAQEQLSQKTVQSPLSGFIVEKYKSSGEYVEENPIVRVAQLDPLLIEAVVPMELFGKVKVGMQGMVYPELTPDQPKQAEIMDIDRMGDAASRTFGVRLKLPNPEYAIPAGLKCETVFVESTVSHDVSQK